MSRTQIVAILDANALVPSGAPDILTALASEMVFTPVWSDQIMDEASRNVRRLAGRAGPVRRLDLMRSRFPLAAVDATPELVAKMTNDEKDRHALIDLGRERVYTCGCMRYTEDMADVRNDNEDVKASGIEIFDDITKLAPERQAAFAFMRAQMEADREAEKRGVFRR